MCLGVDGCGISRSHFPEIEGACEEDQRYHDARGDAPDADGVDDRELEVGQPRREENSQRDERLVLESRHRAHQGDREDVDVEKKTPGCYRQAEEPRPLAQVDGFARTDAAAQLTDDSDLVTFFETDRDIFEQRTKAVVL